MATSDHSHAASARPSSRLLPALSVAALGLLLLLGISRTTMLSPERHISAQELNLILVSLGLTLLAAIPVILFTLRLTARRGGANARAAHAPTRPVETRKWIALCIIVGGLGLLIWEAAHGADPYKPVIEQAQTRQ